VNWYKLTWRERLRVCWRILTTGYDERYESALDVIQETPNDN